MTIGAVIGAGAAFTFLVVFSQLCGVASRIGESPSSRFDPGNDPIQGFAKAYLTGLITIAVTSVAAFIGGTWGGRRARQTNSSIPTDRWPFRCLIVVHSVVLWLVLLEGYRDMVRGPAPPDRDGAFFIGLFSLLAAVFVAWKRLAPVAWYFGVTGLLLVVLGWSGAYVARHDHLTKFVQANVLLMFTAGANAWTWWLLSSQFGPATSRDNVSPVAAGD